MDGKQNLVKPGVAYEISMSPIWNKDFKNK